MNKETKLAITLSVIASIMLYVALRPNKKVKNVEIITYKGHQWSKGGYNPQTENYDYSHLTNCTNPIHNK